jgi:nicotinate phosphoribosyltransferase
LLEAHKKTFEEKLKKIAVGGPLCISNFSEFGLRRRLSFEAEDYVVKRLSEERLGCSRFVGTSNMYLAKKYNIPAIGTQAHEWYLSFQCNPKYNAAYSNHFALTSWVKEYGVMNGIALTDTITTDVFLRDFSVEFATLFSGVRCDSGDPVEFGEKIIKHYESLGIDAKTKTLLFSDSLDFERADKLFRKFSGRAQISFGIGTYLSNDTGGLSTPLNIVMKPVEFDGRPCAKLSDSNGKNMCRDQKYIDYLRRCIDWRMVHEK